MNMRNYTDINDYLFYTYYESTYSSPEEDSVLDELVEVICDELGSSQIRELMEMYVLSNREFPISHWDRVKKFIILSYIDYHESYFINKDLNSDSLITYSKNDNTLYIIADCFSGKCLESEEEIREVERFFNNSNLSYKVVIQIK